MTKREKYGLATLAIIIVAVIGIPILTTHLLKDNIPAETHIQAPVAVSTYKPVTRTELLAAVNTERGKYGVGPLTEDARLDGSAQAKACDEYDNKYFGHINPVTNVRGVDTAKIEFNNENAYYDENLVHPYPATVQQAMEDWDASKVHHDAIINRSYTLTGFGVCGDEVVEHFYGPAS